MHLNVLHVAAILWWSVMAMATTIPPSELLFSSTNVCSDLSQSFLTEIHNASGTSQMPLSRFDVRLYLSLIHTDDKPSYQVDYIIEFSNQNLRTGTALVANRQLLESFDANFYHSGGEHFRFVFPVSKLCDFIRGVYIAFLFEGDPTEAGYVLSHDCKAGGLSYQYGKHCLQLDFANHSSINYQTCNLLSPSRRHQPVTSCCKKYIASRYEGVNAKCHARHTLLLIQQARFDVSVLLLAGISFLAWIAIRILVRLRLVWVAKVPRVIKIEP